MQSEGLIFFSSNELLSATLALILILSLYQFIALCNASIFGVRMYPLIILIIFIGAADPLYFEFVIEHNLAYLFYTIYLL